MNISVSKTVHNILSASCDEAMRTGYMATSADHIMLALLRHADNSACRALSALGVDLGELKDYIDDKIFRSEAVSYSELAQIKPSKQAMATIKNAIYEAYKEEEEVGCLHLLLAICRTRGSVCAEYLNEIGIDYDSVLGYYTQKKLRSRSRAKRLEKLTPLVMNALGEQLSRICSGGGEELVS